MADPVDELEVLVSLDLGPLEDDLEEAVDEMQRLDDQETGDVQDELDDAAESADDLSNSIDGADARAIDIDVDDSEVQAAENAVEDLDGKEANVDVDVDESGGGGVGGRGRDRVRLPGELDEVQEGFQALAMIPPQIQGLAAAATAATAALGAGAGLAGVATSLAAELGPQGLQSEVKAVQSTFKETGREFASAFSGVIRSEVLPAAKGLASVIRGTDEALAAFSGTMIDLLKNIPGGLSAVGGAITGLQAAGRASEGQSNADALAQGTGDVSGIRGILTTMNRSIARVRERFERDLIPKKEMLSQIKSFRSEAFKSLQKLKQQIPGAFPPDLLDNFAAKLRKVKRRLKEVQTVSLEGVAPQPADASEVSAAGREELDTGSVQENIPDRVSGPQPAGPSQEQVRRLVSFRAQIRKAFGGLSRLGQVGARSFLRIGKGLGQTLGQILTLQKGVKSIEGAFSQLGASVVKSLQGIVDQMIQAVTTAAALRAAIAFIPGLNAIGGASSFSGLLGGVLGFEKGGIVKEKMLGVIGEGTESEAVMPLSNLKSMVQKSAQIGAGQIAGAVPSGGGTGRSLTTRKAGNQEVRMDSSRINIEIPFETVATAASTGRRDLRRKGRVGR